MSFRVSIMRLDLESLPFPASEQLSIFRFTFPFNQPASQLKELELPIRWMAVALVVSLLGGELESFLSRNT